MTDWTEEQLRAMEVFSRSTSEWAEAEICRLIAWLRAERQRADELRKQVIAGVYDAASVGTTLIATDKLATERQRAEAAEAAIRKHRDQKADDRCWMDDLELYALLPEEGTADNRVGDKEAMLANCRRFIERRCEGGHWPSYTDLEKRVAELKQGMARESEDIEQTLGKALGYPQLGVRTLPDGSQECCALDAPGAVDSGQVCVGDHVPVTLAAEAAKRIAELEAELDATAEGVAGGVAIHAKNLVRIAELEAEKTRAEADLEAALTVMANHDISFEGSVRTPIKQAVRIAELEAENARLKTGLKMDEVNFKQAEHLDLEVRKLRAFKQLTHDSLDAMGVPACETELCPKCRTSAFFKSRISARLDWVAKRLKLADRYEEIADAPPLSRIE